MRLRKLRAMTLAKYIKLLRGDRSQRETVKGFDLSAPLLSLIEKGSIVRFTSLQELRKVLDMTDEQWRYTKQLWLALHENLEVTELLPENSGQVEVVGQTAAKSGKELSTCNSQ